jgi:GDP-4-dehydro-6-deoxy-D-mannose reductase
MNILVTGAAGFVGTHLANELVSNGHYAIAAVNHGEKPSPLYGQVAYADLSIKNEVANNIDFTKINAVIHLAGLAAVGPSFDDPLKYLNINVGIELNLYEACIKQGCRPNMLIVSSGMLYDPTEPMPLKEDSAILPSSPYAVSKVSQEVFAKYYSKRDFNSIIARPLNHIGPGQKGGFIVPDFAMQIASAERGEISSIRVGDLTSKRDYTDVRDIVRAYRLLAEKGHPNETYNICSGNSHSGQDILDGLLAASDAKVTTEKDPERMRPSDIPEIYGSHDKITQDTGWEPSISLEKSLEDALNDWR